MIVDYREGRPGDGAALSKLFCESFLATFGHLYSKEDSAAFLCLKQPEQFEAELADPDYAFRLALSGDKLMGYVKSGPSHLPLDQTEGRWELHNLYVAEDAKGQGVADTLMAWAQDEARRRGFTHLVLSVFIDNHRARRFYDKRGFVEIGAWEFMVGNQADDDRIMEIEL